MKKAAPDVPRSTGDENAPALHSRYNLTVVPPGKTACPFHNHRVQEEMFFILEGTGLLRFGDREYPLRPHDVIAAPMQPPDTFSE